MRSSGPNTAPTKRNALVQAAVAVGQDNRAWPAIPLGVATPEALEGHPDVGILVHSSWRNFIRDEQLSDLLGPLKSRYIGATPRVGRCDGIQQVVEERQLTDYRILDARKGEFPAGLPHLILCDPEKGSTTKRCGKSCGNGWSRGGLDARHKGRRRGQAGRGASQ